ncbi:hypothetical protein ABBQ38_000359 [Trebouxia sp. C0009 RCD-2024]
MRLGLQHSQTFTCKQPVSLAQGTAKRGRLASPNPVCTFAKQTCTLGRVPYCATWKGRATTLQQPTHHHYTRQHSLGRTIRQCQQEARVHAIVQDSTLPEPGSSDQQDNSQARDEAASTSYQPSSAFGGWVGSRAEYFDQHLKSPLKDIFGLPFKLHYPSRYETGWKSASILLAILVLMGVVSTLDNAFAAVIVWYTRKVLRLSSRFSVGKVLAGLYCISLSLIMVNCAQTVGVHSSSSCKPQHSGS